MNKKLIAATLLTASAALAASAQAQEVKSEAKRS